MAKYDEQHAPELTPDEAWAYWATRPRWMRAFYAVAHRLHWGWLYRVGEPAAAPGARSPMSDRKSCACGWEGENIVSPCGAHAAWQRQELTEDRRRADAVSEAREEYLNGQIRKLEHLVAKLMLERDE